MRLKSIVAATGLLAALAAFAALPAFAQTQKASTDGPICVNCHATSVTTTMLTAHGAKNDASGSACQAFHGDASAHLKDPKNKPVGALASKTATAAEKSAVCLTCHSSNRAMENWSIAKHRKVDVTCVNCHSIHQQQSAGNPKEVKSAQFAAAPYTTTVRTLAYKTCITCHTDVRGEILKPSHHPIIEGRMGCGECHDPHGSMQKASLRGESINDLCLSCHAAQRGAWIHEHPPVEENCAICHTPHGSNHRGLLVQKSPQLCGDCHPGGHTHGIYDGRGTIPGTLPPNVRFVSSGCVNCHRAIHGSNAPTSAFGEFFIR
jgi:DmsE family decaheme c-type cytochrome